MAAATRRWSQRVTRRSNVLDLEAGVFSLQDPWAIARSLKRSADRSRRRKSAPFRSAMSMLVFYINRAGRTLSKGQRRRLERAKAELRAMYGKSGTRRRTARRKTPRAASSHQRRSCRPGVASR
jgi:Protein of unknown function (DUF3175)